MSAPRRCYDCDTRTNDWVMESRETGGGMSEIPTREHVPVCANRKTCAANRERKRLVQKYESPCPVCKETICYTEATENAKLSSHLSKHKGPELAAVIIKGGFISREIV